MGYFQVRYDSRVGIYERKMFIRLATAVRLVNYATALILFQPIILLNNECSVPKVVGSNFSTVYYLEIFHIFICCKNCNSGLQRRK